ncbi:hypothetical protein SBDP1_30053 [Syntrophobacter sp. SbD1]|nr:hypothetical protein SBDP1_30053 [Syntrophobacter sp. SbD1]
MTDNLIFNFWEMSLLSCVPLKLGERSFWLRKLGLMLILIVYLCAYVSFVHRPIPGGNS